MPSSARCRRLPTAHPAQHTPRSVGTHNARKPPPTSDSPAPLNNLGFEGEADILRIPIKKSAGRALTVDQQAYNAVHGALRALGERANSLLKTTFKALRRWRGCPWRIGDVVAAALVLLHHEHRRTT